MFNPTEGSILHEVLAVESLKLKTNIPNMSAPSTEPTHRSLEAQSPSTFSLSMAHNKTPNEQEITQRLHPDRPTAKIYEY